MNIYEETKYIMEKYKIIPNKNLGQNFLFDEEALEKIADGVEKTDTIIEIGPGLGTLTSILLERAKKVIVIELDSRMCQILKERFIAYNNIEIINEDVLKIDFDKLITTISSEKVKGIEQKCEMPNYNGKTENVKVVANLPYYITTPIITHLLKTNIHDITVLIQKEVAERICAKPGDRGAGAITYYVNYYADSKIVADVSKESFIPNPKVESSIVRLVKLDKPRVDVKDEEMFFELIKTNFTKRRKTILNSLSSIIEKEKLQTILEKINIDSQIRGESLTLEQYAEIVNCIEM